MKKNAFTMIFVIVSTFTFVPQTAHAGVWGEELVSRAIGSAFSIFRDVLKEAVISAAKQVAIQKAHSVLLKQEAKLQKALIQNFGEYLQIDTRRGAIDATLAGVSFSLRGKRGSDFRGEATRYIEQLESSAQAALGVSQSSTNNVATIDQHCDGFTGDKPDLFGSVSAPGFGCFDASWSKQNNPTGIKLAAQQQFEKTLQENKETAKTEATSDGSLAIKDEQGNIIQPANVTKKLQEGSLKLSLESLTAADGPVQTVITAALVNVFINKMTSENKYAAQHRHTIEQAKRNVLRARAQAKQQEGPGEAFDENAQYEAGSDSDARPTPPIAPPPAGG